ncbi:hypothetical protein ACFLZ2_05565 [Candidatus Margulisiibacteriota bacterium]
MLRAVNSATLVTLFKACNSMGPERLEPRMIRHKASAVKLKGGIVDAFIAGNAMAREISCYARSPQYELELKVRIDDGRGKDDALLIKPQLLWRPVSAMGREAFIGESVVEYPKFRFPINKQLEGPSDYLRGMSVEDLFARIMLICEGFYFCIDEFVKSAYSHTN